MSAHQVITGALNKGENVFSTGSVDGINFTACAVGTDVVILSSSFDRVQVIPGSSVEDEQIVTCVNCCSESGKIAAAYGRLIRIFEPVYQPTIEQNKHKLDYRWYETQTITMDLAVGPVLWNLEGYRLLICCGDRLLLYQHKELTAMFAETAKLQSNNVVMFSINEEEQEPQIPDAFSPTWESIWAINLASAPKFIQYSPDGCLLATCGEYDRMIKIWFQESDFDESCKAIRFDFIYLQHPAPVSGFEWRKISRYMPRRCVQNVLVSWCVDNTARLWKEAPLPDECLSFNSDLADSGCYDEINVEKFYQHRQSFTNARRKVMLRLKNLMKSQQKKGEDLSQSSVKSFSAAGAALVESGLSMEANKFVQFHLVASVNAENDCFLVPSLENSSVKRKPFSVHWLNNKELMYGIGAERLIAELILNEQTASGVNVSGTGDDFGGIYEDAVSLNGSGRNSICANTLTNEQFMASRSSLSVISTRSLNARDVVDVKLETLIRDWCKTNDVLFAVHPVDGSLLTWTVEWLDDACRQPTVSFTSRFPSAFPLTDAASLNPSLYTFNSDIPVYFNVLYLNNVQVSSRRRYMERVWDGHYTNILYLLTSHENGSLNLWHLSMEEDSKFTTILNVSHVSRMCGHRFQISHVSPHPSLPLMLTSSQFKEGTTDGIGRAELILWKINPVGPLCKSGGVRELARLAGTSSKTFLWVAWIPAILPSCTLGSVCDSPSSCFIASDGKKLSVYQAVVDAASILAEMYSSNKKNVDASFDSSTDESSSIDGSAQQSSGKNLKDMFNVISTQSTAKPGCILYLNSLDNSEHEADNVLFLHVFSQRLALVNDGQVSMSDVVDVEVNDRSRHSYFSDRYFVVLIERVNNVDRVRMWSLDITSRSSLLRENSEENLQQSNPSSSHDSFAQLPQSANLELHSEELCNHAMLLPDGATITSAVATAGHLSSSNLYPACKAPYVLLTSCSDDYVRFWNCVRMRKPNGEISYSWRKWRMIGDLMDSDLELEGQIFAVSAAHSGRFACAYMPEGTVVNRLSSLKSVKIGVFECESSGGVEWLREDTLIIDKKPLYIKRNPEVSSNSFNGKEIDSNRLSCEKVKKSEGTGGSDSHCIRIDWVSTEDGSHLLTVALGSSIYLFTQVSQGVAQRNIVMMKEHETHKRPPLRKASSLANPEKLSTRLVHWLCIRYLALQSADGRLPLPTTISWVRDGILIVGMHSEMRCYNQWNFFTPNLVKRSSVDERSKELSIRKRGTASHLGVGTLNISPSHSMLDQLSKKTRCEICPANKMIKEIMQRAISMPRDLQDLASRDEHVLEAVSDEGLFEAARLANPILPQYHPKQLIELLNSGKTRRVKAILLHVLHCLKQSNVSIPNPLSRAASLRRMSVCDSVDGANSVMQQNQDAAGRALADTFDDTNPEYDELDGIAPLPLDLLMAADHETTAVDGEKAENVEDQYKGLFETDTVDDDLDEMLSDHRSNSSRRNSLSSEVQFCTDRVPTVFTARHNRLLTDFLTHTHLPGLSSVDQMHLLAVADTLSHFSADAMDKLSQANAAFQTPQISAVSDAASGYATATSGSETVDECGLRFLMAMKQHEYLLLCLPLKQKRLLRQKGLSSSNIIWALHSETKTELLNAIPGLIKSQPTWEELRSLGVAWWLNNNASLALVVEKLAHAAFQQRQDPMDASLYYLAMRKKNILTHLFKSVKNGKMADFFGQDFTEEKWRKAAAKNAFVLMSKQRFEHAAAFFLLGGSLKDAVQTVLSKLQDIQLAMVIIRLYETDVDRRWSMMRELLCRQILGIEVEELDNADSKEIGTENDELAECSKANSDPFVRSMTFWLLKEYSRAAATLLQEGSRNHFENFSTDCSLSDIFNFYTFLRNHPLVVRQRLTDAGIQMGSTEQFLVVAKKLSAVVTPSERRLYFRTASAHMASGCPMLALDVLLRLPKTVFITASRSTLLSNLMGTEKTETKNNKADAIDWSVPTVVTTDDELKLEWSDDEEGKIATEEENQESGERPQVSGDDGDLGVVDVIAQHMKFVASLRLMMEEMSTLASGFEVDGGQLRFQLFKWLEKEVDMLKEVCDYESCPDETITKNEKDDAGVLIENDPVSQVDGINMDRMELSSRIHSAVRRRKWLLSNQKLLRSFTSYCTLHSAQNYRLTSALMELLLLLLEVQQDADVIQHVTEPSPVTHSFPLLMASVSSCKMFVSSPLNFIENSCSDLLLTIAEINEPPRINVDNFLPKVYMLYNLCQGLSSCLYQSLCDVGNIYSLSFSQHQSGALTKRSRYISFNDDIQVTTSPSKWPGVDNLLALLTCERDEETPQLRLLLTETLFAVSMSLFSYAFTAYDSRWLYRLAAHRIDAKQFAAVFGGGGEKKLKNIPPRPPSPATKRQSKPFNQCDTDIDSVHSNLSIDSLSVRAKFHAKVFGSESPKKSIVTEPQRSPVIHRFIGKDEIIFRWVPPNKNIVQLFAEKPTINSKEDLGVDYNSDDEVEYSSDDDSDDEDKEDYESQEHNNPEGFAWILMRIALVHQQIFRLRQFIDLIGFEFADLPSIAPRVSTMFRLLNEWAQSLEKELTKFPGGCPVDLIPNINVDNVDDRSEPLAKYNCLLKPNNTPFESDDPAALPVRRLWAYLVRQDHLTHIFVRYLFGAKGQKEDVGSVMETQPVIDSVGSQPEAFKIVSREHEPIAAFACSQVKPGWIVVATSRELQELDVTPLLDEYKALRPMSWLNNRTELDIGLSEVKRDLLKDNDDYQLFMPNSKKSTSANFMSQFVVDRSRMALRKLLKRSVSNIRRMDAHPSLPYYISGSSDGSIRLWEWGVGQPLFTPRTAGQYSKITKVVFSANGNKFAAVDGDGLLCIWQLSQGLPVQKHFFSQKCHAKSAADVRFLGSSSTVLVTAGYGPNDQNIALWDTLMPRSKAMIHAWLGHSEGATSVMYLPTQQALISGGRHGELCIWDVRQRQLRSTVKCFENSSVKCLVGENTQDLIIAGSNDGEIKVWTYDDVPELKRTFNDHPPRSGFSLRPGGIQGVQQLYIDAELQLYSCGADCSLKYRVLPMIL